MDWRLARRFSESSLGEEAETAPRLVRFSVAGEDRRLADGAGQGARGLPRQPRHPNCFARWCSSSARACTRRSGSV